MSGPVLGHEASWSPNMAQPLTAQRIGGLAEPERGIWQNYLDKSEELLRRDQEVLANEMKAAKIEKAAPAPLLMEDFTIGDTPVGAPYLRSPDAGALADVLISYQTPAGGWSKEVNYKMGARRPGECWSPHNTELTPWNFVGTFDNRSTIEQMLFLAKIHQATQRPDCKESFVRGLHYIFDAQYPNGGWPQIYPLQHLYHDAVTFNDNAITNILELLYEIKSGNELYSFLEPADRARAAEAFDRAIEMVTKTQHRRNGEPTAWPQQCDPLTLAPTGARVKEPPSLSGIESAKLLAFLMKIKHPSPELTASIKAAIAWFEKSKVPAVKRSTQGSWTFYEKDPSSNAAWWARFYDPDTNQPIFGGSQDGVIYDSFQEMWDHNNRANYAYFSQAPLEVITKRKAKWEKMLAKEAEAPTAR